MFVFYFMNIYFKMNDFSRMMFFKFSFIPEKKSITFSTKKCFPLKMMDEVNSEKKNEFKREKRIV